MTVDEHPLAGLPAACEQLAFRPLPEFVTDGCPTDDWPRHGYRRASELLDDGALAGMFERMHRAHGPEHTAPATMHFLRDLLRDLIFATAAGVYLLRRAPALHLDQLWVHWDEQRSGLGRPRLAGSPALVLADDPAATHPGAIVLADDAELDKAAATGLVDTFDPIIRDVQRWSRMGSRTMWGYVHDCVHFYMLNPARFLGHDLSVAWQRAERLGDAIAAAGAPVRSTPRLFPFSDQDPNAIWAVRGVCCFDYKDPTHGLCVTCPLQDDGVRKTQLAERFA